MAVPEDERKFSGIYRDLIEDVSVVAVQRLPCRIGAGGLYAPRLMGSKVPGAVVTDPPTAS
ncbi:MAG TPA: hypothetical protein VK604_12210 [Bryobacteraceae bacterium]|nr:hypothetical protein [Bryobacteraceae bacterium]